ncbi:acyl carrier protein [Lacticaseibacillus baoqingensis]|uniref:Acyl carrier protein n=1 Tax=Lacticaseibacillus baoqingensis TaxID=2486013 RepID=A0ABW4E4J6_9LACO|nr:acyl carrier protein [Lacticaseibacillus baoqingensis]
MANEAIFSKVQAIIADQLDQAPEKVQLTTNFKDDLDADSLDVFEIINEIEDAFDVTIDTDETIDTVQDLVTFLAKAA